MSYIHRTCEMKSKVSPIHVLIADNHPLFRVGIRQELERHSDIEVIAEVANGSEVLSQVQSHQPTVLTLGINLREISYI